MVTRGSAEGLLFWLWGAMSAACGRDHFGVFENVVMIPPNGENNDSPANLGVPLGTLFSDTPILEFQGDQKCVIDNHEARGLWAAVVDMLWTPLSSGSSQVEIVQGESQAAAGSLVIRTS